MDLFSIGNVLGRAVLVYALIWLVLYLLVAKRDWRAAFRHTGRWYGVLATITLTALGVAISASQS
jgi:predicted acyltransferase